VATESLQINSPNELQDAFKAFNDLSVQLSTSYNALEQQVVGLTEELAASKSERIAELQEKELLAKRLESILHALPAGVVVLDGEGVIQNYNAIALELLGEPLDNQIWNMVSQRVFDIDSSQQELRLKNNKWVTISTCPLGKHPGQIILLNDVTERKHQQIKLDQQQRLVTMGQTAASLAHQIRTPLSSAILYSSNLKRQNLKEDDRFAITEKLMARLRHLEHLVNDMLVYASGSTSNNNEFKLTELVSELLQTTDSHLVATKTRFNWLNRVEQDVYLKGNKQMLMSSLINLFVNAIQAMGNNGELELITYLEDDDMLFIEIKDNGPGIDNKDVQSIFEPFYTTKSDGTGLGLAVVRAVVNAHNGEVQVEHAKPNGTIFKINIPVYSEVRDVAIQHRA